MKEQIRKDVGDSVTIQGLYDPHPISGIISMIIITKKGIKYRATFQPWSDQRDFEQDEIIE